MSITISITIPDQLEKELQEKANHIGISRSRFIGNILLKWQDVSSKTATPNDCRHRSKEAECVVFGQICNVPEFEARTCSDYLKKE